MTNIYFVCMNDGNVIDIIVSSESFEDVYQNIIGKNYGEFLAVTSIDDLLEKLSTVAQNLVSQAMTLTNLLKIFQKTK